MTYRGVYGFTKRQIAKIAVSAAVFAIDRPYSYIIPENLVDSICPGVRVTVPFGRGNRRTEGIVLSVCDEEKREGLKPIESVLDDSPVFSEEHIKLALWMRDRFFCTLYEAARAMLPAGMWFSGGEKRVGDKTKKFITLAISGEEAEIIAEQRHMRAPQQSAVLRLLSAIGEAAASDICSFAGVSPAVIASLEKKGLVTSELREVYRRPLLDSPTAEPIRLTDGQERVFYGLKELLVFDSPKAALLYGVTGSGKTSVYVRLVQEALSMGRGAIVLVPEIGLTPQFVEIFSSHFADDVAVLHSSLTAGERYDEWKRINAGLVHVVIGTRSAVFAPLKDIGLIIIDEEQEHTYKSENSPRYHARDIAKYRCVRSNGLLVLGSATPSVDSMYSASLGRYSYFELESRYNERPLPEVLIADMRAELKAGNGSSISSVLKDELRRNIDAGEQSILFLNRRGASSLVMCGECGYTFTCRNCSVSMTYHSVDHRLRCHYCGHSRPLPEKCPECGGKLKFIGAGTQKLETELHELFPGVEVIRMDTDTVSHVGSHQKLLSKFKTENIPILIGTQMVTKGLDFENVTLAGVISADQSLYAPDYRAHERTFSLITQVVGRSGRGSKTGRAVIQTFTPENEIICLAAKQDYKSFYAREIELRRLMSSPPIRDLISVTVTGPYEAAVLRGCMKLDSALRNYIPNQSELSIFGPAPAGVTKVNNRFRYKLSLSCENSRKIRDIIGHVIREFSGDRENRGLSVFADADPVE
ncbi:MAG: primosomal protein N' [Oscillospiraceae bacterium]